MTLADKIVVLDAGRVAQVGSLWNCITIRQTASLRAIGSPKMNFLRSKSRHAIDQVQVELPEPSADLAPGRE